MEACRLIPFRPRGAARRVRRGFVGVRHGSADAAGGPLQASRLIVFALVTLVFAGCCGQKRQQTAVLERENRELEDAMWQLHFEAKSLKEENARLRDELGLEPSPHATEAHSGGSQRPHRPRQGPSEPALPNLPSIEGLRPPVIELPGQAAPEGAVPESLRPHETQPDGGVGQPQGLPGPMTPRLEMPPEQGGSEQGGAVDPVPAESNRSARAPSFPEVTGNSRNVAWITLGRAGTGGTDLDGRPGDDGIAVVVEPRSANEELVPATGDVSVVLLDPSQVGQAARVARWDFTAADAARSFEDGIHLEMPWPERPPSSERLHLFVRYTTSDGRRLEADTPIELDLTGRKARSWTATHRAGPSAGSGGLAGRPSVGASAGSGGLARRPSVGASAGSGDPRRTGTDAPLETAPLETASLPRVRLPGRALGGVARPAPNGGGVGNTPPNGGRPAANASQPARRVPVWSPNRL